MGKHGLGLLTVLLFLAAVSANVALRADPLACQTGCGAGGIYDSGTRYTTFCPGNECNFVVCNCVGSTQCSTWGCPQCRDSCPPGWLGCPGDCLIE